MPTQQTVPSPVAIGGIGGSGTRVIARMLAKLGYYLGADLNEAEDNQAFTLFFKRLELWPPEQHSTEIARAWAAFENSMTVRKSWTPDEQDYLRGLAASPRPNLPEDWLAWRVKMLIDQLPAQPPLRWGWKEPNTHIVLPELLKLAPELKYIHVVRHGLDMAYSDNQEQLVYWGAPLLGEGNLQQTPANSFRYWCAAQRRIMTIGQAMRENFLLLNFDHFCENPQQHLPTLLEFLGIEGSESRPADLLNAVSKPLSSGRHKTEESIFISRADRELLRRLGFTDAGA